MSTETLAVNAIASGSITVSPDPRYGDTSTTKSGLTYTQFSKYVIMYDRMSEATYDTIQAGDSVKLIIQDLDAPTPETMNNSNPMNEPANIRILAVVKVPALTSNPANLYQVIGKDIVRAEPCTSSESGFCRVYEFAQ